MSMADEVRKPQHSKTTVKKKKSFSEAFIPHKNDSPKEIASKIFSLFSMLVLIVCCVILGVYFYQQFEAKQNNANIKVIYNQAQKENISDDASADGNAAETPDGVEVIRKPLVNTPAADEMLAINKDYVGYIYIPDVLSEAVVQTTDNEYYLNHNFYDQKRSCGTVLPITVTM